MYANNSWSDFLSITIKEIYTINSWSDLISHIIISFLISFLFEYFVRSVKDIRTLIKKAINFTIDSLAFTHLSFYNFILFFIFHELIEFTYKKYIEQRNITKGDRVD
jgi:hypothetical protein